MGRFGSDPHAFFSTVYNAPAPWDVGGAQPAMAALLRDFPPAGPVLDVGCGTGDLAIHVARAGLRVVGVDFIETAIAQAREKAAGESDQVRELLRFEVGDAARPSSFGMQFGAVVDSGFLHLLDEAESDAYVADLRLALAPGGRLYVHEFAIEFPVENVPRAVTEAELRERFVPEAGWRILELRHTEFLNTVAQPTPAIAACVERI